MDWGSVADWLGAAVGVVGILLGGGYAATLLAECRAQEGRFSVRAEKVPGLTRAMKVRVRYVADDLSSAVLLIADSDEARFYDPRIPQRADGRPDIERLNREAVNRIFGKMRHSGAPDSLEFTGSFTAIWDGESAPLIRFSFEQPKGRRRYARTRRVSPVA